MKKYLILFFVIFLIPFSVFSLVVPSDVVYVTDDANVIQEDTKNYMIRYSDFLKREVDVSYYVVTVPNLEDFTLDNYVDSVFATFGMGKKDILIFFAKSERTIKVMVGGELSYFLDDSVIQEYINLYFMPYFKNEDWDTGLKNGYSAFYKAICNYYDIDSSPMEVFDGLDFMTKYRYPVLMGLIFFSTLLSYIFCKFFKKNYRKKVTSFYTYFLFGMALFANILIMFFVYYLNPWFILIMLAFELFTIYNFFKPSGPSFEEAIMMAQAEEKKKEMARMKKIKRTRKTKKH